MLGEQQLLAGLAAILVLGVGAEWLAWKARLPSILVLLAVGLVAGPVTGALRPDDVLGDLVSPVISLSVAIILFEGALTLRWSELKRVGGVVMRLVGVGALVTWVIAATSAWALLGFDVRIAILFGAVLVVNGPSVIGSLLKNARPVGRLGSILKSETVVLDTVGAMLAVLVFQAIAVEGFDQAATLALRGVIQTVVLGSAIGAMAAAIVMLLLSRFWIPDPLENPATLMFVVVAFTVSNTMQPESGFFAAAVMGVVLANQRTVAVRHIAEFEENLRILIVSGLFVILAARLEADDLAQIGWYSALFLVVLVLVARPVAVALATARSRLRRNERAFLAWMAPRGFVAAALSSVFAIRLAETDIAGADRLVAETFFVIVATVLLYTATSTPVARLLGVTQRKQQGVLVLGAYAWTRELAKALMSEGFQVLLVDTNRQNIQNARMEGIPTHHGSILADDLMDRIDLDGIGRLLAVTSNNEVNSLAVVRFSETFGRSEVYQFSHETSDERGKKVSTELRGRTLFSRDLDFASLTMKFTGGAEIRSTPLTKQFDMDALRSRHTEVIPLFLVSEGGDLIVCTADSQPAPKPGQTVISLVRDTSPRSEAPDAPEATTAPGASGEGAGEGYVPSSQEDR